MKKQLTLLLVDDEQLVHRGMRAFIDWSAYGVGEILSACNAFEAIDLAAKMRPEIIISDIRMPGMNGFEMIERLQNELPDSIFIMLSGYDEFSYAKRALSLGALGYLLKPVEEKELREVMRAAVKKLSEEEERANTRNMLRRMDEDERSRAAELILQSICKGENDYPEEKLHIALEAVGCHLQRKQYGLFCLSPMITSEFEDERSMGEKLLEMGNLIRRTLQEQNPDTSVAVISGFLKFTVIFGTDGNCDEVAKHLFFQVKDALLAVFETGVKGCYGGCCEELASIHLLYSLALSAIENLSGTEREWITPESAKAKAEGTGENQKMAEIKQYIRDHLGENITLSGIAAEFYYNPSYLSRRFKEETGVLFLSFLNSERIVKARQLIDAGERSTYLVCEKVGYKDYRYFINMFKKYAGQTPYQYVQLKERS